MNSVQTLTEDITKETLPNTFYLACIILISIPYKNLIGKETYRLEDVYRSPEYRHNNPQKKSQQIKSIMQKRFV